MGTGACIINKEKLQAIFGCKEFPCPSVSWSQVTVLSRLVVLICLRSVIMAGQTDENHRGK
jgi:hypothetical protein